jgi:GT2 family glycosyltransferase
MTSSPEHDLIRSLEPLFEEVWYLEQYPEAADSDLAAISHYLEFGDLAGYRPLPLFDPDFYSLQHPELPRQGGARLAHYVEFGEESGSFPTRLFDPLFYRHDNPDLESYTGNLLGHYQQFGASEMRSPNALFAAGWYCDQVDEIENARLNPLIHYLEVGDRHGLFPHPLFDPSYYGSQQPDLPEEGGIRLAHYLHAGGRDGCNPHPLFRSHFYLEQCPELAESPLPPLVHYLSEGEARGLLPNPIFDPKSYLDRHPDLVQIHSALIHYVEFGASEQRAPNPLFSTHFYREQLDEESCEDQDLLAHYLDSGDAAGSSPHPLFDPAHYSAQRPQLPRKGGLRLGDYWKCGHRPGHDPHPLFNSTYYASQLSSQLSSQYPPTGSLLIHYLERGEYQNLKPNPLFDPAYYERQSQEVDRSRCPLLEHFSRWGGRVGLSPSPLFDSAWVLEQMPASARKETNPLEYYLAARGDLEKGPHPVFLPRWYLKEYPEALASEWDPLSHFMEIGAAKGFDPHPLFNSKWYRDFYADSFSGEDAGAVPIFDYLESGESSGLLPNPLFDPSYYLNHYRVQLRYGEKALSHFCRVGAEERCQPSRLFSFCLQFFRNSNPSHRHPAANPAGGFLMGALSETFAGDAEIPIRLPIVYEPDVSIIIPMHGQLVYTLACLRSLSRAESRIRFEVIVVDDFSAAEDFRELTEIANLRILRNDEQLGFLHSCNRGAAEARGKELVFLNNDTLVTDEWLDRLLETRESFPDAGLIGSQLLFPDGRLQEAGSIVWEDGTALNYGYGEDPLDPRYAFAREVDYISAAAVLIATEFFHSLGGFDEVYAPAFYEDTDLAFRIREAGKEVVYQPRSHVIHFGGASHGRDISSPLKRYQARNADIFLDRWRERLAEHLPSSSRLEKGATRLCGRGALVIDATMLTPDLDSGSLRMFNLLLVLRQLGFAVSLLPSDLESRGRYADDLRQRGVQVICRPHIESIERFLERAGNDFELCIISRPDTAENCLDLVRLLCPRALLLYDTVDLHFLRRERELRLMGVAPAPDSIRKQELHAASAADAALTVSEFDREKLLAEIPGSSVHVISNIHRVYSHEIPFSDRNGILFIGSFQHSPNADAVLWFIQDVLPTLHAWIPDLRFHIVGANPPDAIRDAACEYVIVEGFVEDVDEHFATRKLSIAPLRYGSGVKGKINQSMAHGLPCVATPVAVEGMDLDRESEILVAESALDFAEAVAELYENEALWREISKNSALSIERSFSMEVAREGFRKLLQYHGRPIPGS